MLCKLQSAIFRIRSLAFAVRPSTSARDVTDASSHAPNMFQLEDRILYSASPLGAILEPTFGGDPGIDLNESPSTSVDWFTPLESLTPFTDDSTNSQPKLDRSTELIIIDSSVDGYEVLANGIFSSSERNLEIAYLEAGDGGIDQITEILEQYSDLDAVHLVSHGNEGSIQLGASRLTLGSLQDYSNSIASWSRSLSENADLLFYGCDLAASSDGESLIEAIRELTGADVAASDDLTGHGSLGGDWMLEFTTGSIESMSPIDWLTQQSWLSALAITANDDGYSTGENTILNVSATGVLGNDSNGGSVPGITAGATLNYDASLDLDGNNTWEDITGVAGHDFTHDPSVVYDNSLIGAPTGITAAYVFDGTAGGVNSKSMQDLTSNPTNNSATFEIWFRPDSPSDNQGFLFDTGSSSDGTNLRLYENSGSSFIEYVVIQRGISNTVITADITTEMGSGDYIQLAATIDIATGTAELFVNGLSVGTDTDATVNDWAGVGEGTGIGQKDGSLTQINSPHLNSFKGEIAIFRFYEFVLTGGQVLQNHGAVNNFLTVTAYDAVSTSAAAVSVNADGSFSYDPGTLFDYLKNGETFVDTFTYTAENELSETDTATVSITITGLTEAPTAISPTAFNINENVDTTLGTSVGLFSTTDEDTGDTFTYSIQGGADQLNFSIGGAGSDELILTDGVLDFETKSSYSVTVRVTDSGGNTYDEAITVNVSNLNETPTAITPTVFNINENVDTTLGTSVGLLSTTDDDTGDTFTYSIQGGVDSAKFSIGGAGNDALILTDGTLDFETKSSYAVTVRVTDSGGNTYDEAIAVNVNNLNETPTAIVPASFNINENVDTSSGTSVGTFTTTDDDTGKSFTYSIAGGADQLKFTIGGAGSDELILSDGTLDFETKSRYSVTVRVTDSGGNTHDGLITVNVNDLNESPTGITPANFNIRDQFDTSDGTSLGGLTAIDQDAGESFTYTIQGGADQAKFSIGGAGNRELILTDGELDSATKSTYTVIVRVTDSAGNVFDETITVDVIASIRRDVDDPLEDPDVEPPVDEEPPEPPSGEVGENDPIGEYKIPLPQVSLLNPSGGYQFKSDSSVTLGDESESTTRTDQNYYVFVSDQDHLPSGTSLSVPPTVETGFVNSYITDSLLNALNDLQVEVNHDEFMSHAQISSTVLASASITAGYVIWLIRSGVLLSSILTSLPAWRTFDPLPVLGYLDEIEDEDEDDSLESLVDKSNCRPEALMS